MDPLSMNETTDATAIFGPLWKHKWLILAVGILVAGATYAYYKRKPTVYAATTQLYLGNGAEEQGVLNEKKASALSVANQTALINSSLVGEAVHQRLRKEHDLAATRGKARAKSAEKSEFITITAEAHTPHAAAALANATAQAYITRQHVNYLREIRGAIAVTREQLRRIEPPPSTARPSSTAKGKKSSGSLTATLQAATLNTKINQLESDLLVAGVKQINVATRTTAQLLSPAPKKNAIFGFVLGLVLASIAAYTLSRFDRRLRGLADIEAAFQAQILTALPTVRRPIVRREGRLAPSKPLNEPLRRLQTSLQLTDLDEQGSSPRSILFISADAGDGKSTVVADLALVQREGGEHVAVIEADFRRPALAGLLDVAPARGLAEVLAGTLTVEEAMQQVPVQQVASAANSARPGAAGVATVVESSGTGSVSVLLSGSAVANPPALLARSTVTDLVRAVADDFDYVLIDAPPPLQVSDVMPLLAVVDGIVIVARAGHTGAISAQRLMQLLGRVPGAPVLGVVANCVPQKDIGRYGFSSVPSRQIWYRKLIRR
jgi:succinoglycan biosynthesis transport protein ExoP